MAADVGEIAEKITEGAEDDANKWHSIFIAVLAVMLAVCGLGGGNNGEEMMTSIIEMSDTYNFYQAKSVRQTMLKVTADNWELTLQAQPDMPAAARQAMRDQIDSYRKTISRYESDPESGEGKKELLAKAKTFQDAHAETVRTDPYFDFSETLLQVSIVLMSIFLLTNRRLFMLGSYGLGAAGGFLLLNAFTHIADLPFL